MEIKFTEAELEGIQQIALKKELSSEGVVRMALRLLHAATFGEAKVTFPESLSKLPPDYLYPQD